MNKKSKEQIFEERQKMGVKQSPMVFYTSKEGMKIFQDVLRRDAESKNIKFINKKDATTKNNN